MFSYLLFAIEILTAEFLFTFNLKRRKYWLLRYAGISVAVVGLSFAFPFVDNVWYTCFVYFTLFAVTVPLLQFVYKETWSNLLFCAIAAYTTQHLSYQFASIVFSLVRRGSSLADIYHINIVDMNKFDVKWLFGAFVYLMCFFTVYVASYYIFARRIKKNEQFKIKNMYMFVLLVMGFFINIILNAVMMYGGEQTEINTAVVCVYICFCCFLLLSWQFELGHSKKLQTELNFVRQMLRQEKEQYKMSKANIDLINLKCHDMKHQIREIGNAKHLDSEAVAEIEKAITIYDTAVKTDNEALDVILTEKSVDCLNNNIILSCMADGKKLDFMKDSDVYSLFGNALDNAIEAVSRIADRSKRVIGLKVFVVGELVTVNVKNFYDGELNMGSDGLPKTMKSSDAWHGFGMKSIRLIAEKYDGSLSVKTQDNVFNLNILLPIKKTAKDQ